MKDEPTLSRGVGATYLWSVSCN